MPVQTPTANHNGANYLEFLPGIHLLVSEKKGHIRIPLLTGYGKMTPLENGKTELVYEVLVDVGGWVPKWIVNFYQANTAYITFQNLRKLLPLEKYKDVRFSFIKYPDDKTDLKNSIGKK